MDVVWDVGGRRFGRAVQWALVLAAIAAQAWSFYRFSPLTYGYALDKAELRKLQWMESWDFV